MPNTPAAETLTSAEVEKRTSSYNARRALLRSNPSLFISRTRLSVRQIPVFVTERLLKHLANHAVRKFEFEAKKGLRAGLTEEELADHADEVMVDDGGDKKKAQKSAAKRGLLKQAKIVRQLERVDPITGKGRSKGYGFIEMREHADALRVLRWSNNNPEVGPLFEEWWKEELEDLIKQEELKQDKDDARLRRLKEEVERSKSRKSKGVLIVEFSIENIQVVQRRNAHQKEEKSV
jgi:nucleolar protein 4